MWDMTEQQIHNIGDPVLVINIPGSEIYVKSITNQTHAINLCTQFHFFKLLLFFNFLYVLKKYFGSETTEGYANNEKNTSFDKVTKLGLGIDVFFSFFFGPAFKSYG